jgi:peptide/nickel transport system permease protein
MMSTATCCALGVVLGASSGWSGRAATLVGTALDTIQAFPPFLMTMLLATLFRPSYSTLVLAISFAYCPIVARGIQSVVRTERAQDYVWASIALGQGPFGIALRHILPNGVPTLIVLATNILSVAILTEAGLSFLGLGPSTAAAGWGRMVFDARPYMERSPQTALAPLAAISLMIVASNILGDWLREVLDPRISKSRAVV